MNAAFALGPGSEGFGNWRRIMAWAIGLIVFFGLALGYVLSQRDDLTSRPYLQILGGGFVFNYRVDDTFYGFTARIVRPVPVGTILEASFEDPAGGAPIVIRERVGTGQLQYALRTPELHNVQKDHPYKVEIRLLDRADERVIWETRREYRSALDQSVMPEGPLTVGPGYTPAPAGKALLNQ